MKDLKDILESLLDIDNNIDNVGHEMMDEFERIKKYCTDKKNWKVTVNGISTMSMKLICEIPEMYKLLSLYKTNDKTIVFDMYKHSYQKQYKGSLELWGNRSRLIGVCYKSIELGGTATNSSEVIKNMIKPMFKDIHTFINYINDRL